MDKKQKEFVREGFIGLLAGVALLAAGIWQARQFYIVWTTWPTTDGVVVRSVVRESLEVPYAKGGMPFRRYAPQVEFRYMARGKTFTTEAPSVYTAATYEEAANNMNRLYAPGSHHPLRYNPADPRDIRFGSVPFGPVAVTLLFLAFGAAGLALGLNGLAMGISRRTEPTAEKIPAKVLPFAEQAGEEHSAATLVCPSCGRRVEAIEENCPNCLAPLRAA